MSKGKPLFRQSDLKRAFDAARKMNLPLHSVEIKRDGSLSLVIDRDAKTNTADPMTTITEAELKDLI